MIKRCLNLLKGWEEMTNKLYLTLKIKGQKKANKEVVWWKSETLLLNTFVNCNYYMCMCSLSVFSTLLCNDKTCGTQCTFEFWNGWLQHISYLHQIHAINAVTWLKYYQYGVKRYPINQSIHASMFHNLICIPYNVYTLAW